MKHRAVLIAFVAAISVLFTSLSSAGVVREAGAGGSNPLTPTI